MKALSKLLKRGRVNLEIQTHMDPGDGSVSMDAIVRDSYTDEVKYKLEWYYDFEKLIADLNRLIQGNEQ